MIKSWKFEDRSWKDKLQYLFDGNKLTREQAKASLIEVGKGMHSEAEFASFLTVFKMRPIESDELAGFRDAMVKLSTKVDLSEYNGIDVVGTGGDGKNTFNISTLSCFIIAGAGVNVTKHGNYASSSTSGSSNVLEFLGYKFSNEIVKLKSDLEKGGFCFSNALPLSSDSFAIATHSSNVFSEYTRFNPNAAFAKTTLFCSGVPFPFRMLINILAAASTDSPPNNFSGIIISIPKSAGEIFSSFSFDAK